MYEEFLNWTPISIAVEEAPNEHGIYCFGQANGVVLLYIGRANGRGGIRQRVAQHIGGRGNKRLHAYMQKRRNGVQVAWVSARERTGVLASLGIGSATNMEVEALRAFCQDSDGNLPKFNSRTELQREGLAALFDFLRGGHERY